MTEVTVIDTGCDDIAGRIASAIEESGGLSGDVLIRSIHTLSEVSKKKTDILVLTEDAMKPTGDDSRRDSHGQLEARISCSILLLPGDADACGAAACDADADIFDAECIVTYGMSPKNTITLSSISEDTCVLALQRDLVTIKGDILERQEIKIGGGMRPECLLAVTGALLILGQKISDINE